MDSDATTIGGVFLQEHQLATYQSLGVKLSDLWHGLLGAIWHHE
jgi:hypothetical protein